MDLILVKSSVVILSIFVIIMIVLGVLSSDELKCIIKFNVEPILNIIMVVSLVFLMSFYVIAPIKIKANIEKEYGLIVDKNVTSGMAHGNCDLTEFTPNGVGSQVYAYSIKNYNMTIYKKVGSEYVEIQTLLEE